MSKDIKRISAERRAADTTKAAKKIVEAETEARDAKTARLKRAREKREAEDEEVGATANPSRKVHPRS